MPISSTPPNLRVLGIDPGTRFMGYAVVERQGTRLVAHDHGVVDVSREPDFQLRLTLLHQAITNTIARHKPTAAAIERVFAGKNMATAIRSAEGRGAIRLAIGLAGLPLVEYAAREIKQAITGRGGASKPQVASMIGIILNIREVLKPDAADALAVAVCAIQRGGFSIEARGNGHRDTIDESPETHDAAHPREVLAALMRGSKQRPRRRSM